MKHNLLKLFRGNLMKRRKKHEMVVIFYAGFFWFHLGLWWWDGDGDGDGDRVFKGKLDISGLYSGVFVLDEW